MKEELINEINSPCCNGFKCRLEIENRKQVVNNNIMEGRFYFYQCQNCGEKWTTTKSDTLSLLNFKHKKL